MFEIKKLGGKLGFVVAAMCAVASLWSTPAMSRPQSDTTFSNGALTREFFDRLYQPNLCAERCRQASTTCHGWTYESPPRSAPIGTAKSVCRLYTLTSPFRRPAQRTISALAEDALADELNGQCVLGSTFPIIGFDPFGFVIDHPNPQSCADICKGTPRCTAWTYTRAFTSGSPYRVRSCVFTDAATPSFAPAPACLSRRKTPS